MASADEAHPRRTHAAWLPALRRYALVAAAGNLAWECVQLPLFTLWQTGSAATILYAVLHCTGGDMLIAGATLGGSLLVFGTSEWPRRGFLPVAAATVIGGIAYTAYSEHVNTARGAWAYSGLMPLLPGTGIGLAPLAQWLVIPALAFAAARSTDRRRDLDLPTMVDTTSLPGPARLPRSDRRPP